MKFKKVSIILHTINRYHITKEYIGKALRFAGYPFELCVTDNGSNEPEIFEWIEQQHPKQYIKNGYNAGTAQSINRMIQLNPSDYYCFIGNDIDLPDNWLRAMVEHAEAIPGSGMIGINWRPVEYATETINGKAIWKSDRIFGDVLFSQQVIDKLGGACEDYGVYGLWDSDFAIRCKIAGFINYYIAGMRSEHMANDYGEQSEYRRMKDESLSRAKPIFEQNVKKYEQTGEICIKIAGNEQEPHNDWVDFTQGTA